MRLRIIWSPYILILITGLVFLSCKKMVQIAPPAISITTSQVFSDSADADAAITGIYSNMYNNGGQTFFGSGSITLFSGTSADELVNFQADPDLTQFYTNSLTPINPYVLDLWGQAYSYIYKANACIEGLESSTSLSGTTKDQFIGEAKFLRAFCYFYLTNIFGDVPYITSSSWEQTSVAGNTSQQNIYEHIISDLKECQDLLRTDYSISGGERTRANRWAATALLARVYLYTGDFINAASQATAVIDNTTSFGLVGDLNNVFLKNSSEAILQWQVNTTVLPYNLTNEGYHLIPVDRTSQPSYYISTQLLSAVEPGDQRYVFWFDSTINSDVTYHYPYKYKIGLAQYVPGGPSTEYYMVLREAEQYLIRAEARAKTGDNGGAIGDINIIRNRAGLPGISLTSTQEEILSAINRERRIELFAEWGHRWFDLKRTGQLDSTMSIVTPQKNGGGKWEIHQRQYPIPLAELQKDPNLIQNSGY